MSKHITEYTNFPFKTIKSVLDIHSKNEVSLDRLILSTNYNNSTIQTSISSTKYSFQLFNNKFTDSESVIIICSKDNDNVLEYSLSKLYDYEINKQHDILLIDDRSSSENILWLSNKFNTSYLRIDNSDDIFNYSVLNNIGALYAQYYNKKLLIFYNNDVFPSTENSFQNIVDKHKKSDSDLSGCRLVYPLKTDYELMGSPQHILESFIDKLYNTIQHGGIYFSYRISFFMNDQKQQQIVYVPNHLWRFHQHNHVIASSDSRCCAVTGALHIIDTDKFIDVGGLNQSMCSTFQDIDFCLKLLERNMSINYIGSEYMYHGESITILKENSHKKPQTISDNILWDCLWRSTLPELIGVNSL